MAMKYKSLSLSLERYEKLKCAAKASGSPSLSKYLDSLMAGQAAQHVPEEIIEQEVEIRLKARLTEPTVARLIDEEVSRLVAERTDSPRMTMQVSPYTGVLSASPHSIEDCARALIDMLPEATRDFAYEICESVLHIEPSQLIYGHLMGAADSGRLQAPLIDPSWETQQTQGSVGPSICEWHECRKPFTPVRHGQRYCSNVCGGKAATAELPIPSRSTRPILEAPGMQGLVAV
jgi:hypothetical protein